MITQINMSFPNSNLFIVRSKTIYFKDNFFYFSTFLSDIEFTILNEFLLVDYLFSRCGD
jgi:hypothetical protein